MRLTNKSWRRCMFGVLLVQLAGQTLQANTPVPATTLTLERAIALTLDHNPDLYQFPLRTEVLKNTRRSDGQRPLLQLELEVENIGNTGAANVADGSETTLALSSVIELGGDRQARISLADSRLSLLKAEQQAATLDVLGELTRSFVEGLTLQAQFDLARQELLLASSTLSSIEERVSRGAAAESEALRAHAALIRARLRADALAHNLERKRFALAGFWGSSAPTFDKLQGELFSFATQASLEELQTRVTNSPASLVFAEQDRLKKAELQLTKAESRANLSWRLGVQYFEESGDSALTAGVALPLNMGARSSARMDTLQSERALLEAHREANLLNLKLQVHAAWSLYQQQVNAVKVIDSELLPQLQQALVLTERAYERGRERYESLVSVREQVLAAKQMQIEAAGIALNSHAVLEQLSGQPLSRSTMSSTSPSGLHTQ